MTTRVKHENIVTGVEDLERHRIVRRVIVDKGAQPSIWVGSHGGHKEHRVQVWVDARFLADLVLDVHQSQGETVISVHLKGLPFVVVNGHLSGKVAILLLHFVALSEGSDCERSTGKKGLGKHYVSTF